MISGKKLMRNKILIQTKQEHNLIKIQKKSNTDKTSVTKKSVLRNSDGRNTIDGEKSPKVIESYIQKRVTNALRLSQSPHKLN